MPHLLRVDHICRHIKGKSRVTQMIEDKMYITYHALERIDQRIRFSLSWKDLRHRLALRIDNYELDERTKTMLIKYRGRRVLGTDGSIITFMKRAKNDTKSKSKKYKEAHEYRKMSKQEVIAFRENVTKYKGDILSDTTILGGD